MVLQKRLDYGFNGYQVPAIPRGLRTARGRASCKKKVDEGQMCAFELLATVAGKLLQEKETSTDSSNASAGRTQQLMSTDCVKQEQLDGATLLNIEPCEEPRCNETVMVSEHDPQGKKLIISKDLSQYRNDGGLGLSLVTDNTDNLEKLGYSEPIPVKSKTEVGIPLKKVEVESDGCSEGKLVPQLNIPVEAKPLKISNGIKGTHPGIGSSEDLMDLDIKPPPIVSSDSSVKVPICKDRHSSLHSFPGCLGDEKVVNRDDDENSSGCTRPSIPSRKALRSPPHIGDRRIRKILASKYWKVAPKLKEGEVSKSDMKFIFHNRKTCYSRDRSQRNFPFKKRKFFGQSPVFTSGGTSNEGMPNSSEKGTNRLNNGSANRASSSISGQRSAFHSRDSHVKLSIKSFRIPELFIEIPETATVGSLKRTVMEAVNAILGEGLRVGVVLKGNKVRDDNKTLQQTGISHEDKLDTLGFTLEPNPAHTPPALRTENSSVVPCNTTKSLTRYPTATGIDQGKISSGSPFLAENNHDSVRSRSDVSEGDDTSRDSRALVAIPTMSMDALSMVPLHRKSRRSDLVQRRIRRPFSVTEVEALVQAVEKLGTGRWRDVKLRAFDNAKHRTYVDLKDKWKTLVHTARISPQQRRGEPVPQELLDRVLAAHAYWSKQQVKQQFKQQQNEACLLN